jgi:hypothetical protein
MSSPARVIRMVTLWSGRKSEPVTRCPLALIAGVRYECGAAGSCDSRVGMSRSYRAIGPARWSMLQPIRFEEDKYARMMGLPQFGGANVVLDPSITGHNGLSTLSEYA